MALVLLDQFHKRYYMVSSPLLRWLPDRASELDAISSGPVVGIR